MIPKRPIRTIYYQQVLKNFDLSKDDVVYFEHNENAVKRARSVGIDTYYYDNEKKDLKALKAYLVKNL
jgi:FMN phosphatase YigB (HAD superfamily)